ncbi:ferrichrome ABC transporter, permease protein [Enterococcus sp. HSIEG1]|nr:ferrichrome ABC transporter, permease protein [Enterococcus sp. HSIEG1]
MAPHIAKRLIGKESRWALIAAGMIGAILVLVSDTVGRLLLQSGEIPAGIVIAIIGAPYFFVFADSSKNVVVRIFSRLRLLFESGFWYYSE